ncbi:short chain dehydrogenase [Penicillium coprophilum]|uniref:short chain dehydrogenase n=1 Tax=Penicillium coprophilum TaxID=36646 RepID=UPI0023A2B70A|nr:short chain dehydrogenase [Penicillium coprophilum]KAJ5150454.1 short chain dehydrogenase [Penicillium coprophilum]
MQKHTPSVLITGCGKGGIGHALAVEFQNQGFLVFTTLLAHEPRDHLTGIGITALSADVTNDDDIRSLRESISDKTGGRLDILVNNANIGYTMTGIDTDVKEVEKMFGVNVFGPMRMVHIFHPLLIRAQGKIVNIGSVGGIVPYVYGSSYNATKAALHHWGNTLRVELKPLGVEVVNIISGEISTNILKRDQSRRLPDDSFYRPLAREFENHEETTTPHEYAMSVVAEVTKRNPRIWFWTGATSSLVWFGDTFLPRWIWCDENEYTV